MRSKLQSCVWCVFALADNLVPVFKNYFPKWFPCHTYQCTTSKPFSFCFGVQESPFSLNFPVFQFYLLFKKENHHQPNVQNYLLSPITIHPLLPFLRRGFKQGCLLRELLKRTPHPLDTAGALEAKSFALATGRVRAMISIDGGHALITKGVQPWGWEALFGCILGTDDPALLLEQYSQLGEFCKGASEFCAR